MSINDEMNKFLNDEAKKKLTSLTYDLLRQSQHFNPPHSRLEVILKTFGFIEPEYAQEAGNSDQGYWINNWFDAIQVKPEEDGGFDLIANFYTVTVKGEDFTIDILMHHLARGLDSIMSILSDDECGIDPAYCKEPNEDE